MQRAATHWISEQKRFGHVGVILIANEGYEMFGEYIDEESRYMRIVM